VLISYCDRCGILTRAESIHTAECLCTNCRTGAAIKPSRTRDSGQIPYAQRPSTAAILREIQHTVRH